MLVSLHPTPIPPVLVLGQVELLPSLSMIPLVPLSRQSADLLDTNIRSAATRLQVQKASSPISKRRHIVTAIQPADLVAALEAARDA